MSARPSLPPPSVPYPFLSLLTNSKAILRCLPRLVFKHKNHLKNLYLFYNRRAFDLCSFSQATLIYDGSKSTHFTVLSSSFQTKLSNACEKKKKNRALIWLLLPFIFFFIIIALGVLLLFILTHSTELLPFSPFSHTVASCPPRLLLLLYSGQPLEELRGGREANREGHTP